MYIHITDRFLFTCPGIQLLIIFLLLASVLVSVSCSVCPRLTAQMNSYKSRIIVMANMRNVSINQQLICALYHTVSLPLPLAP